MAPRALPLHSTRAAAVQGNCSDPDAAAALGVSAGEPGAAGSLLPLKPRQCLILLPDAFLMANGGTFWLDNVYLRLERTLAMPDIAVISAGGPSAERLYAEIPKSDLYLTNVTFQGEFRGSAQGVALTVQASSALVQGALLCCSRGRRPVVAGPLHDRCHGVAFRSPDSQPPLRPSPALVIRKNPVQVPGLRPVLALRHSRSRR